MATDIYIGYMDEEVASLLTYVLKGHKAGEIHVFERGLVKQPTDWNAPFLERPFSSYTGAVGAYANDNVKFNYHSLKELFSSKKSEQDFWEFYEKRVLRRIDDSAPVKVETNIVSEVVFDNIGLLEDQTDRVDRAYVIRSGEMGKQPGLVRLYLRMVLRYLKKKLNITDVNIYSYAAGGGIKAGAIPGTLHDIKGSVFVGPDVDELGQRFPNVELIYQSNKTQVGLRPEFKRTGSQGSASFDAMAQMAENVFLGRRPKELIAKVFNDSVQPAYTGENLRNKISASFSYFDGTDTKEAVDEVYNAGPDFIINSNMEDYHLLRILRSMTKAKGDGGLESLDEVFENIVTNLWSYSAVRRSSADSFKLLFDHILFDQARSYPKLNSYKIVRVATNVRASGPMKALINAYIGEPMCENQLSTADLTALINWGKKGCPITKAEIDLLPKEAKYWHKNNDGAYGAANLDAKTQCSELIIFEFDEARNDKLVKSTEPYKPNQVDNAVYEKKYKKKAYCLNPFCVEIATDYRPKNVPVIGGQGKLWLRGKNKWKGVLSQGFIDEAEKQDLSSENIKKVMKEESNIDRILYKSSGTAALQMCVDGAWGQFHP